jgi:hypothetical protein
MKKISIGLILLFISVVAIWSYAGVSGITPASPDTGLMDSDNVNIDGGTIDGVNIGTVTPATGAFTNMTVSGVANITTIGTNLDVGSSTTGANLTVRSTMSAEMSPSLNAGNWTLGYDTGGWTATNTSLVKTASTGTQTVTPSGTFTVTAGKRYEVIITASAVSGTLTYTLGSVTGTTITATTITDEIIASTSGKLIISGGASVTATITSISVKEATSGTGNTSIGGALTLKNSLTLARANSATYPALWIPGITNGYLYQAATGYLTTNLSLSAGSIISAVGDAGAFRLGTSADCYLVRDAANNFAFRQGTTQQKITLYNTYTDAGNYERISVTGVNGSSVNITAESNGTGAANLDIVLTPKGTTGEVKVVGALTKKSSTATTGGGLRRTLSETTSGTLSGATGTIAVNVPTGARIHGIQLRVDTAVTSDTGVSWSAVYVNTPTAAICTGQAFTKDTKFNAVHPTYEITTGTVTITVAPNAGTFTGGVIRAVVYYEDEIALLNSP